MSALRRGQTRSDAVIGALPKYSDVQQSERASAPSRGGFILLHHIRRDVATGIHRDTLPTRPSSDRRAARGLLANARPGGVTLARPDVRVR